MEPILQVENLNITFKRKGDVSTAVHSISFDIYPGEFVAIVGESGSGKSVTALSLLQLLPLNAVATGTVLFNGLQLSDIGNPSEIIKHSRGRSIGMIFQEPMTSLNPVMQCGKQVSETLQKHLKLSSSQAKARTIELFRLVELPDPHAILKRYPHQLSGGQRQRVMIAIAICCNPGLLIADEPTTALDAGVQANIISLLRKISFENKLSVLLITHDLGIVSEVADRVIVMQKGKIEEQGVTKEVLTAPRSVYTKALIACRPSSNDPKNYLPVLDEVMGGRYLATKKIKSIEDPTEVITVNNLHVHYKLKGIPGHSAYLKAVNGVSMEIRKNEIAGLVGESGCGKSSFGKALLQLIPVTSGEVFQDGIDIISLSGKELRKCRNKMQMVFQDPYSSLNPSMKIREALMEPLIIHKIGVNNKWRLEKIISLMEKLELKAEHLDRYPHEFSGGQRQRVCIARALISDPTFVVFDESVSALDVSVQAQVLNLITKLKAEMNFSALFISHDLAVVKYISDRIFVMKEGEIVESGTAEQIYLEPKNSYTRSLIEAIPGKDLHIL